MKKRPQETDKRYSMEQIEEAILSIGTTTRTGLYSMSDNIYFIGLKHYLDFKIDVLQEYDKIIWSSWEEDVSYSEEIENIFNGYMYWNVYDILNIDEINNIKELIQENKEYIEYSKTYEYRRREATIFLANKTLRKEVFKKCGKICALCKTTKKLSIDHIIPIIKNGDNNIENLQVLCTKCNSSKGGK